MSTYLAFLQGLLLAPRAVSAPTPSGPRLADALAGEAAQLTSGLIVELGPGTGVVTRALLKAGVRAERIVAVECCEHFVDVLRVELPKVVVHCGDAVHLERYLPSSSSVAAIVSGIPLLNFDPACRKVLIQKALRRCSHFIQLSYGWSPPVPAWQGVNVKHKFILRNFPPAHIWHYTATSEAAAPAADTFSTSGVATCTCQTTRAWSFHGSRPHMPKP